MSVSETSNTKHGNDNTKKAHQYSKGHENNDVSGVDLILEVRWVTLKDLGQHRQNNCAAECISSVTVENVRMWLCAI